MILEMLGYYLIFINILAALFCLYDKIAARNKGWRVSEATLLWLSVLGGSVAMFITMKLIRHKTLHKKFMIGIPVIIIFQIALALFFYFSIDKLM